MSRFDLRDPEISRSLVAARRYVGENVHVPRSAMGRGGAAASDIDRRHETAFDAPLRTAI